MALASRFCITQFRSTLITMYTQLSAKLLFTVADGHQRVDNLHAVVPVAATGVNLPGNLVKVVTHADKLTKQRWRNQRKFAGSRRLLVQARLPHPGRELLTVAAFQQTPVLVFRYPHGEHFAAFVCQSGHLITPGRAGNLFPVGAALDKPQARQWLLAGFGAQP